MNNLVLRRIVCQTKQVPTVIVGGGPAGVAVASKCPAGAVLIEAKDKLGGTCLLEGCIPSKFLIKDSHTGRELDHVLRKIRHNIALLDRGQKSMLKSRGIEVIQGEGAVMPDGVVHVDKPDGTKDYIRATNVVLATGSVTAPLGFADAITSKEALNLVKVPKSALVIGGGAVGLEFACMWNSKGCDVTIVEQDDAILPQADKDISTSLERLLKKRGIKIHLSSRVLSVKKSHKDCVRSLIAAKPAVDTEIVLDAAGRRPRCIGNAVTGMYRVAGPEITLLGSNRKIWKVGDADGNALVAHKAIADGEELGRCISTGTKYRPRHKWNVPLAVFTAPEEVAGVGRTEDDLRDKDYVTGRGSYAGLGAARVTGNTVGFCKVLCDKTSGTILGGWIIGEKATELISILVLAIDKQLTVHDLAKMCTPHPTLAEVVREACNDAMSKCTQQ